MRRMEGAHNRISFSAQEGTPPFQTVVYFPGADAIRIPVFAAALEDFTGDLRFYYQERTGRHISCI